MPNLSKLTYKGVTYTIYDAAAVHGAYSLPVAKYNVLGGVMPLYSNTNAVTGVTATSGAKTVAVNALSTNTGRYYAVEVDKDGRLYANVPWTDNNFTYSVSGAIDGTTGYKITLTGANGGSTSNTTVPVMSAATSSADGKMGLVPAPAAGNQNKFLRGDGTWQAPSNYTYSIGGAQDGQNGFKITLTGANGGSTTSTTVPRYAATADGLVPMAPTATAADGNYFLRADGQWDIVNRHHIWLHDSEATFGGVLSGEGTWTATFPSTSMVIGNSLKSCSGYTGTPRVGDTVVTTGGYIGYITQYDANTATNCKATFVGRFSFMAYNAFTSATATAGTGYDASTETLILGMY